MKVKKPTRMIRTLGVVDLARALGMSPGHVSQVLSGKKTSRRVSEAARGRVIRVGPRVTSK